MVEPLLRHLLRLSPEEASFSRRKFAAPSAPARARLEGIGRTFILGYNEALRSADLEVFARRLERVAPVDRGFACEGAAMALTLLDLLLPSEPSRLGALLDGPGRPHVHLVHVGAGWALARLRRGERDIPGRLDPLLRWLALDGYGFHNGYFAPKQAFEEQFRPRRLTGYAERAYDQGLGRSLWFVAGADIQRVAETIERFPAARRADLWSGIGLAATYAGGATDADFALLLELAASYTSHIAQGAAFAAKAREAAGPPIEHTERACRLFCRRTAAEAAAVTDAEQASLRSEADQPEYEIWRRRIRGRLAEGIPAP